MSRVAIIATALLASGHASSAEEYRCTASSSAGVVIVGDEGAEQDRREQPFDATITAEQVKLGPLPMTCSVVAVAPEFIRCSDDDESWSMNMESGEFVRATGFLQPFLPTHSLTITTGTCELR